MAKARSRLIALALLSGVSVAGLATPSLAAAKPRDYRIDPVHTRVLIRIGHAGFSTAMGTFSGITGTLRFDPDDPAAARVDVRIPVTRLDLGDADWNHSMLTRAWLDAERHPEARYRADRLEVLDDGRWRVQGQLSLRGQTLPVVLHARLNAHQRNPLTLRMTLGVSATATLRRSEFGMQRWAKLVGDEVEVAIELEAVRGRLRDDGRAQSRESTTEDDHADPQ